MSESRSRRETETESSIEVVQIDGLVSVFLNEKYFTCTMRTSKIHWSLLFLF